jgi:hypothetical protein
MDNKEQLALKTSRYNNQPVFAPSSLAEDGAFFIWNVFS